MKALGLYIHVPFCKSKCLYCDFCSLPRPTAEDTARYTEVICRELLSRAEDCADRTVDTVYFGGGTPTVLTGEQFTRILETVFKSYRVDGTAEITSECNPATADRALLREMRAAGFNRISVGIQSAHGHELRALGRIHSFRDAEALFEQAVSVGFSNLSADVMLGIPYQTPESFAQTLERVAKLDPTHVSAYALTVEEGTPFGRRGAEALDLPDEDTTAQMYLSMIGQLADRGFLQYEISNFAKRGYESRHNLKYWNTEEYLGFGPAAHSDFGGVRFSNAADVKRYLSEGAVEATRETLSDADRLEEYVMLQMRLARGLDLRLLSDRFGAAAGERFSRALGKYEALGFVCRREERLAFTPKGMLVSNSVLSEVLCFHR